MELKKARAHAGATPVKSQRMAQKCTKQSIESKTAADFLCPVANATFGDVYQSAPY
jgi:hypothetical protein